MDDFDIIRRNADRVLAQITDYVPSERPSVLAKCVYLYEASLRFDLNDDARQQLDDLRREIAVACGIEQR